MFAQTRAGGPRDLRRAAELITRLALKVPDRIVRVVGTNGKGTVTTMVAAGLTAAGFATGRFLSPHVESFTERVAVDGVEVDHAQVLALVRRALEATAPGGALDGLPDGLRPSFFEWTLALALESFAQARVDYAVMEAGVGGAQDATSALARGHGRAPDQPHGQAHGQPHGQGQGLEPTSAGNIKLVILTNVDLDHTDTLGATVEAIATEKAGAIAAGVPVVTGAHGVALAVVGEAAASRGAPLHVDRPTDPLFTLPPGVTADGAITTTRLANARLAAAGLRLLGASEAAVAAAVTVAALPGRGERFTVAGRHVLLDGAHDPAAAGRLVDELEPGYVLLYGSLARKQGRATLSVLAETARAVVITEAQPGEGLAAFERSGYQLVPDPAVALDLALELAGAGGRVVVAGSLYLAGRLRPLLHSRTA